MSRLLLLACLSACNLIFPLRDDERLPDGATPPDVVQPDSLLNPPDGSAPCGPAPAFEMYRYQVAEPFALVPPVEQFGFFRDNDEVRAIATAGESMFEVAAGVATQLPITAPENTTILSPRTAYDGAVVWFQQSGQVSGTFFADRASGWVKQPANLGFVDDGAIEPGSAAFYAGTVRMVVSVRPAGPGPTTLREISSPDGITWTALDTIQFTSSALGDRNPALSADGCFLLFIGSQGTNELRFSPRDPDGTFKLLMKLGVPSTAPSFPVLTPDAKELWFTSIVGADITLFRGTP